MDSEQDHVADEEADAKLSLSGREERARAFLQAMDHYVRMHEALNDLINYMKPHIRGLDSPERKLDQIKDLLAFVPKDRWGEVAEVLKPEESPTWERNLMVRLVDRFFGESWGPRLVNGIRSMLLAPARTPILMNSLLTNMVSTFEEHLGQLTTNYYKAVPQALDAASKEREFSLIDLKSLGNIDEAVDIAVARRVDKLLFGGFAGWKKFYKERAKIDFEQLAIDWDAVQELFQRRHAIVHNGARASRRYVAEVGGGVKVGDSLDCDEMYVRASLDELHVLGVLTAIEAFRRFGGDDGKAAIRLHDVEYAALITDRWRVAERLSAHGLKIPCGAATSQVFQVNLWLARKNLRGLEVVRREIAAWDVSAESAEFKLAKACLLDDVETAFALLPPLVESKEISVVELLEWPLLEPLRSDERFGALRSTVREFVSGEMDDHAMI